MCLKNCFYIAFLLLMLCFSACTDKTKQQKKELHITLLDSSNHSSRLVSVQIFNADSNYFAYVAGETKSMELYAVHEQGDFDFLEEYQLTNKVGGIRALTNVKIKDSNLLTCSKCML